MAIPKPMKCQELLSLLIVTFVFIYDEAVLLQSHSLSKMNTRLNQLEKNLGTTEAADLLRFALPFIAEREALLKSLLLSGDLEGAAKCAHKTLGSLGLYGTPTLEGYLKEVKSFDKQGQDLVVFQEQLSSEFNHVVYCINTWLDAH